MANATFSTTHRVTYAECTVGDHLYYGRFLEVLEAARGEFFRRLGVTFLQWQQAGIAFPVVECQLRYRAMAHYDDLLTIELWITQLERVRFSFGYRVHNEGRILVLEAATQHVCATAEGKPRRLPENLQGNLQPYLHALLTAPAGAGQRP
jgi:acyl-CoA thioester hydrolase